MADLMERTVPAVRLTRRTLLEVFRRAPNQRAALDDPHTFAALAVGLIREKLAGQVVQVSRPEPFQSGYEIMPWRGEVGSWRVYLVPADGAASGRSAREQEFTEWLEQHADVQQYVKPPAWFSVPTPLGEYQPAWLVIMDKRDAAGTPLGEPVFNLVRPVSGPAQGKR
jgi:type III restriction enzyme